MKRYFSHFNAFDLVVLTVCVIGIIVFYPIFWVIFGITFLIFVELALERRALIMQHIEPL